MLCVDLTIIKFLKGTAARQACSMSIPNIGILWRKLMAALAMSFRSVFCAMQILLRENLLQRISSFISYGNRSYIDTIFLGQFRHMINNPINLYSTLVSSISGLLSRGCPPAVQWFVIPIGIYALKAVPKWSRTHIIAEQFKGTQPSLAYFNPTATIVVIVSLVFISASLFHAAPRNIKRMLLNVSHDAPPVSMYYSTMCSGVQA